MQKDREQKVGQAGIPTKKIELPIHFTKPDCQGNMSFAKKGFSTVSLECQSPPL